MKRILLPAGGAVLATGLLAAGLAGAAQADPVSATDPMAKNTAEAKSVASFWTASNNEALKQATAYYWDAKELPKLVSGGKPSADGKAGSVLPTGEAKVVTPKVKNINLPKTIGKVFFVNKKGEYKWCSATSIHAKYRNLVATAGHCVYDVENNGHTLDNWVFVPGYYQGKAPWGIYVGKQAWTHYDFDVYEDYDRDYAFVTVYNGIHENGEKQVTGDEFAKFTGPKWTKDAWITEAEYKTLLDKYGPNGPQFTVPESNTSEKVGHDYPGKKTLGTVEVTELGWEAAKKNTVIDNIFKNGEIAPGGKDRVVKVLTESEYKELLAKKAAGGFLGKLEEVKQGDLVVGWRSIQYYVNQWYKIDDVKFGVRSFFIGLSKDAGRLGDNVGGQGFAWNQKTGQPVYIFGYPAAAHGDGNKPFTGVTPKWCYGKPTGKVYVSAAHKVEEHVGLKCSMTPGADGSPWLIKYNNSKRLGLVNGVTSLFGDQDGNSRYDLSTSAYFDGETAEIYNKAANVWSGRIVGPNGELYK
ncbi:hypothetical protein ACFFMN_37785 [Planobispora siamensis]|uniref:V8-like Glu-specific endopeptidase n=1 Tax=Planobispora siamensis TaxID=936338 RepID=A0A8J3SNL6_9ACTN|nr:hypothetical protein [Planobispora siamensis]GIH96102.1 hypothetical protein Psi01_67320 [Planobispora siamensis]